MSDLVPASDIERIVGVPRHATRHFGRAVSSEQKVYILHSQMCLDSGHDLRDCIYSIALDYGIDLLTWVEDQPVMLTVVAGRLWPEGWPREQRLPKWARDELHRLRQNLASAETKLAVGSEDSNTFADPYGVPRPLGRDTIIEFYLNDAARSSGGVANGAIRVRIIDGKLDISGPINQLVVEPCANHIRIWAGDR